MTADDLGLFGRSPGGDTRPGARGGGRRADRYARDQARRRRRRRRVVLAAAVAALVLIGGTAWYGVRELRALREVPDYQGTGVADVVVRVEQGDSTSAIATRLVSADVVASAQAFTMAAENAAGIRSVQPGYFQLRTRMSGQSAVSLLLDPQSRVGQLEVRAGMQLDDVGLPDGSTVPGTLSLLSEASCAELNGASSCVDVDVLRSAMADTPPDTLGVPAWAVADVAALEGERRLEGLIAPGNYDVRPGSTAKELLQQVMATSSAYLQASGLPDVAQGTGREPYEVLIIASVIERESIASDFDKVSRVIYNRLAENMPLQMDSTINYPLDRQEITTTDADRARPGPYNTYLNPGLPPSPIGAASTAAVTAAIEPEEGPWRYFVKCETDGTSCFTVTIEQHRAAVASARARGIF